MTISKGILAARSHIAFMLGLIAASAIVMQLEKHSKWSYSGPVFSEAEQKTGVIPPLAEQSRALGEEEVRAAMIAWSYFVNNTQPETGLVNSVDGFESSTMWDQGSYLLGLISAHRLGIVSKSEFDQRIVRALQSMSRLELFDGKLPNKVYNTRTLAMVNYQNEVSKRGIGWSAIDIARICVPLNIIAWNYAEHATLVKSVMASWKFPEMIKNGVMFGAQTDSTGATILVQEGRLGYEEYAARALGLIGIDALEAGRYDDHIKFEKIFDVNIGVDDRDFSKYHAHNYVVSEPYILMGIELGFDSTAKQLAGRLLLAQEQRFKTTAVETAVSEDNIDQPPYFVYNTVFANGKAWNAISEDGKDASAFRSLSTKAVFGWNSLYRTAYTTLLEKSVSTLNDGAKGWYSGRYEATSAPNKAITANSNGVILEALCYRQLGRLVGFYE